MSSKGDFDDSSVLLKAGLCKGHIMIDAGCGDGHISLAASGIVGKDGYVHALDVHGPSIVMLDSFVKEKGLTNIRPALMDITMGLPFPNADVDMVMMSNVLHGLVHNEEETLFLREVKRVLRPGGKFAVIEFRKEETDFGPPLDIRLSMEDIKALLTGLGLEKSSNMDISPSHYMAVFIKDVE
ncbi:MAG: class I SAM-dependent methyltransferase [Candidatus Thermoplasmatota archaeon]|nr:class I SAM-dependent methyltransferase [Candidatus Thermoplasmatota archaeon]